MQYTQGRLRTFEEIKKAFIETRANFDNEMAYDGKKFVHKVNGKWLDMTDEEVYAYIDANIEQWATEEDEGLKMLNVGRLIEICPVCEKVGFLDALSRKDNSRICGDCGIAEALQGYMQ